MRARRKNPLPRHDEIEGMHQPGSRHIVEQTTVDLRRAGLRDQYERFGIAENDHLHRRLIAVNGAKRRFLVAVEATLGIHQQDLRALVVSVCRAQQVMRLGERACLADR